MVSEVLLRISKTHLEYILTEERVQEGQGL